MLIIQNDAECIINFTAAKLQAEAKGYIVKIITIKSTTHYCGSTTQKQDFSPIIFIYKIAGAMSEEGNNIDEIYSVCNSIANSGEMILLKAGIEIIKH